MANAPEVVKAPGMVPDELKQEPRSKGITFARKKKPKELAVITECCTGCAGSPACVEYCPVEDCMFWVPDEDNPPFGRIRTLSMAAGTTVAAGSEIASVDPGDEQVWEALRALYLIGQPDDLPAVRPYQRELPEISSRLRQQALLTEKAIRDRATH